MTDRPTGRTEQPLDQYMSHPINRRRIRTLGLLLVSLLPLTATAQRISTFAGGGFLSSDGVNALQARLDRVQQITFGPNGSLYLTDQGSSRIRAIDTNGIISTIAGTGFSGYSGDLGSATTAQIAGPWGMTVSSGGDVIISDSSNYRIRRITAGIIRTIAGNGVPGFGGDGGLATFAQINFPMHVAVTPANEVFFAEWGNHRVRKIDPAGVITTVAGTGTSGFSGDGGAATVAALDRPWGLALMNTNQTLLIADRNNHRIRALDLTTGIITTFAGGGAGGGGFGSAGFFGDGGLAINARLSSPRGIAVSSLNEVFIADNSNERVRKVDTNGIISTVAGNGSSTASGDGGLPIFAGIGRPSSVTMGPDDSLYIADDANDLIRRVEFDVKLTEWQNVNLYGTEQGGLGNLLFRLPYSATMGNRVYFAGGFSQGNLTLGSTVFQNTDALSDPIMVSFNENGVVNWGAHVTATQDATSSGIVAAESENRLYAAGTFRGTATFGATLLQNFTALNRGWLTKLRTSGTFDWAVPIPMTFTGSIAGVTISDLARDTNNTTVVLGEFATGTADFGNGVVLSNAAGSHAFLARYDTNGQAVWAKLLAEISTTSSYPSGGRLVIHTNNSIYAALPHFTSSLGPAGGVDVTLANFDELGNMQWKIRLGSAENESAGDLALTPDGDLFFLSDFGAAAPVFGAQTLGTNGITSTNLILAKVSSTGSLTWRLESYASGGARGHGLFYDITSDTVHLAMKYSGSMALSEFNFNSVQDAFAQPSDDGLLVRVRAADGAVLSTLNVSSDSSDAVRTVGQLSDGAIFGSGEATATITEFTGTLITNTLVGDVQAFFARVNDLPVIGLHPVSQTNDAGTNVTFNVVAGGGVPLSYQWQKDGSDLPGQTNSSLTVSNISILDQGGYAVVVTNNLGAVTSSNAMLTVNQSVTIISHPASKFGIETFSTNFSVTPFGSQPFSYQWFKDSNPINGGTNNPLVLSNLMAADAGNYHAVVSNPFGSTNSFAATLTIFSTNVLPRITAHPQDVTTNASRVVSFNVTAEGQAPLSYAWRRNGSIIPGALQSQYFDFDVQPADAGTYQVVVSNAFGTVTSSNATLSVIIPEFPGIVLQPNDLTINAGNTMTLAFTNSGTPPFNFQWVKDGIVIPAETTTSITRANVTLADGGVYQAIISNDAGSTNTREIQVTVWTVPTITQQPLSIVTRSGLSATFTVAAQGVPEPQFQWFKDGSQATNIVGFVGAQSMRLSTVSSATEHVGNYFVRVFNPAGFIDSTPVSLTVLYPPKLDKPGIVGGKFSFALTNALGSQFTQGNLPPFQVQFSSDLTSWQTLSNGLVFTNGQFRFEDVPAGSVTRRVYRIIEP